MDFSKPVIAVLSLCVGFAAGAGLLLLLDDSPHQISVMRGRLRFAETAANESQQLKDRLVKSQRMADDLKGEIEVFISGSNRSETSRREDLLESRLAKARQRNKTLSIEADGVRAKQLSAGRSLPSARKRFARMERFCKTAANWSRIAVDEKDTARTYGHTTGIRTLFWTEADGIERMQFVYASTDKAQLGMGSAMWLVICAIGGEENDIFVKNSDLVAAWNGKDKMLMLIGGAVHIEVDLNKVVIVNAYSSM